MKQRLKAGGLIDVLTPEEYRCGCDSIVEALRVQEGTCMRYSASGVVPAGGQLTITVMTVPAGAKLLVQRVSWNDGGFNGGIAGINGPVTISKNTISPADVLFAIPQTSIGQAIFGKESAPFLQEGDKLLVTASNGNVGATSWVTVQAILRYHLQPKPEGAAYPTRAERTGDAPGHPGVRTPLARPPLPVRGSPSRTWPRTPQKPRIGA